MTPPTLYFDPNGDRMVRFEGGGGMLVSGAEVDRLGVMVGDLVVIRGRRCVVSRMVAV